MSYNNQSNMEKLIATAALLMSKRGKTQEVDVLRQSIANLTWDNYQGDNYGNLYLEVPLLFYGEILSYKDKLEESISSVIDELKTMVGSISVVIKPKLEAPDNWRENLHTLASSQFGLPKSNNQYEADIFMLMPFQNNNLDIVYRDHICKSAKELNLTIKRGDDFFTKHSIVDDIWSAINAAKIIIAECTGRNANVFYELGISHALGKQTIMITQNSLDVPFDLQQWRYIKYVASSQGLKEFGRVLTEVIETTLKKNNVQIDKPPSDEDEIPF